MRRIIIVPKAFLFLKFATEYKAVHSIAQLIRLDIQPQLHISFDPRTTENSM